jgi:hypothetical protein
LPQRVLGYSSREVEVRRPWLLVALSTLAILAALVSMTICGFTAWGFYVAAVRSTPPAPPAPPTPLPPANVTAFTGNVARPGGLTGDARAAFVKRFLLSGPFADDRRAMLTRLAAEAGADAASPGNAWFSVEQRAASTEPDAWLPEVFTTDRGTIRVGNNFAEFTPTAGASTQVREFRVQRNGVEMNSAVAIEERLADLKQQLPQVTPLQLGRLAQLIDAPFSQPRRSQPPRARQAEGITLNLCQMHDVSVLSANTDSGQWYILADGRSVLAYQALQGVDPATGAVRRAGPPPFVPRLRGSHQAMWAISGHAAVGFLLALLLLVIAVAQLCGWPRAGRRYMHWAGLKLLMIVAEGVIAAWFLTSMAGDMQRQTMVSFTVAAGIGMAVASILIQLVGVAALLLVMMSRPVREYYAYYGRSLSNLTAGTRQWLATPAVRTFVLSLAAVLVLIGIANVLFALWFAFAAVNDVGRAFVHVIACAVLILPGLIMARRAWSTRKALAPLLLIALFASSATAQTKPAEFTNEEKQTRRKAEEMVRQLNGFGDHLATQFDAVLELGEPAQVPALEFMSKGAQKQLFQRAAIAWGGVQPLITERNRAGAIDVLRKMEQVQAETLEFLDLYGEMPEAAIGYAKVACGFQPEEIRRRAVSKAMLVDPSGKYLIAHIAEGVQRHGGHPNRYYDALKQIGDLGIPVLIEFTQKPDLDRRIQSLRAMRPTSGDRFNDAIADKAVDLYFNGVSDLPEREYQLKQWDQIMKTEALATLRSMGTQGKQLADDLVAGKRPIPTRRREQMATVDAPADIVSALFPPEPTASVSDAQFTVIKELAALHKSDARAAVEKAMKLAENPDASAGPIAIRFLGVSPAVTKDDLQQLITLARNAKDHTTRRPLLQLLLGGKFEYSDDLRRMGLGLLNTGDLNQQDIAIRDLAAVPLGRVTLAEALEGRSDNVYSAGIRIVEALAVQRPALKGIVPAQNTSWTLQSYRDAFSKLVLEIERNPDQAAMTCLAKLDSSEAFTPSIAAGVLDAGYASHLGPATMAKVRKFHTPRNLYNPPPLVAAANRAGFAGRFTVTVPTPPPPTAQEVWSQRIWYASGIAVGIALVLTALAVLWPMREGVAQVGAMNRG